MVLLTELLTAPHRLLRPFLGVGVERGLIGAVGSAALVLGAIERKVGIAHQRLDGRTVARPHGRADAGPDVECVMVHLIGL